MGPIGVLTAIISKGNRVKCPYCKGYVDRKAVKCPHCQSDIELTQVIIDQKKRNLITIAVIIGAAILIIILIMVSAS